MIFVSHNHNDKILVEQFALRLRDIFGQDKIFYDSWSIQPGDGIIGKMNDALAQCQLFLLFVSNNSLQSKMVELEWQNAIMRASRGNLRVVPIRLDNCAMPAILLQTLHIDLYSHGLEVALRQVVDVASGRNTFQPVAARFSNLCAYVYQEEAATIVEIRALHYMEPVSHFVILVENPEHELDVRLRRAGMVQFGFNKDAKLADGRVFNGHCYMLQQPTVPGFPLIFAITPKDNAVLKLGGVMHEEAQHLWQLLPLLLTKPATP